MLQEQWLRQPSHAPVGHFPTPITTPDLADIFKMMVVMAARHQVCVPKNGQDNLETFNKPESKADKKL